MKKLLLTLLLFASCYRGFTQTGTQSIQVTDMIRIKQISSLTLSHNGKMIAFTVNEIITDKKDPKNYTYQSKVWIAPVDGSQPPKALTDSASSQPAWSADDKQIAFITTVKGKGQVFVLDVDGGKPVQVTSGKYGVSAPQWAPKGKQLLFSSSLTINELLKDSILNPNKTLPAWATEKPGVDKFQVHTAKADANGDLAAIRSYLSQDEADRKLVKVFNKLNFEGEATTEPDYRFTHYFITDAAPGAKARPLTNGFYSFNNAQFTPDGQAVIVSAGLDSVNNPDRVMQASMYTISLKDGSRKLLLSKPGLSLSNAAISPSGRYMVYTAGKNMEINISDIFIYDLKYPSKLDRPKSPLSSTITSAINESKIDLDRNASNFTWSPDEKYLYFTAQSNGGAPIYRVVVNNAKPKPFGFSNEPILKPEPLADFNAGLSGLDVGKNQVAYIKTEVANPYEIYVADLANKAPKRLTSFNYDWLKDKKLSFPEKKYYTNSKGMQVEYWIMKPTNFEAGKKYPVMLQIHGGPTAMWGPGEASMWHEYQYFCAQGYGIVYSNPRGSGGYGINFTKGNYQDWGTGPSEDVLAALDGTLAQGWGDANKTVVTGGSYAGYLTAWLVGHTNRFTAASAQRGVYDLTTFFGEGNAWRLVPMYFGGYPWDEQVKPILARESPFTYVNKITTPFLILHGETDLRTGIVQGEMMYKALKVLNRPVEYVQHPAATHELTRSGNVKQRIDQMLRIYEFFGRYVK